MKAEHFEFKDHAQAFARFYEVKKSDDDICLVISTHEYSSGYWIEHNAQDSPTAYVYRTREQVERLQKRLTGKIERSRVWRNGEWHDVISLGELVV